MKAATKERQRTGKANVERKSKTAEIDWHATLVEALNAPGAMGKTYCRFYDYSFLNQVRLLMQGVNEPVATYNRWKDLGFQVQKGRKAKAVLAPLLVNKEVTDADGNTVTDPESGKPLKRQVLVGFRESRSVFAFSDTDGDQLPEVELPEWDAKVALRQLNVKRVPFRHLNGNVQGYSVEDDDKGRRIAINPAAHYPAKTLLHELAHIVLGHCKAGNDEYELHRGICEFEAEATAYLVAKELELAEWDAAESRQYIDDWLAAAGHDPDGENGSVITDKVIGRIFAAANKILVAGRSRES